MLGEYPKRFLEETAEEKEQKIKNTNGVKKKHKGETSAIRMIGRKWMNDLMNDWNVLSIFKLSLLIEVYYFEFKHNLLGQNWSRRLGPCSKITKMGPPT